MLRKHYKILIALILTTLFLDMASTYGVATHLMGEGLSMQTILSMERNPIISLVWNATNDIQIGVLLNYVLFSGLLVIPLWYFSKKQTTKLNSTPALILAPIIVNCFFMLGFVNNSLYLITGQGIGNLAWNLVYLTTFLIISIMFLKSHFNTPKP